MNKQMSVDLSPEIIPEVTEIVFGSNLLDIQSCDLIFIFGGSHPGLWETAAQAYHDGLGEIILATGGYKPGVQPHHTWRDGNLPESHVIRRELIKLSVPEQVIVCEDRSTNTLENVLFAQEVFEFSGIDSILALCKNYGLGRQCRTLNQQIPKRIQVIPYPFDTEAGNGPFITRKTWMNYAEGRNFVFMQLVKIYQYGKLGHLEPVAYISPTLEELVKRYVSG